MNSAASARSRSLPLPVRGRALLLAAIALAGCAGTLPEPKLGDHTGETPQIVPLMPPPGKVEIVPPRPKDMKHPVWVDGEWEWTGRRWTWKERGWHDAVPGEVYAPATTKRLPDGRLVHFPGTWKKAGPPGG